MIGFGCSSGVHAQSSTHDERVAGSGAPAQAKGAASSVHHYEYVFPDGAMYVYDMDAGQRLVQRVDLPMAKGIRGVVASPPTHTLYISYGGDGGANGNGSMLAYDLVAQRVLWTRSYASGIDSMAISPDGLRIYMPTGELDQSGVWDVLDASNGNLIATIHGGSGAHNTVMSLDGRHVYLGGREHN
jgi:DNA-binding beta-propeller fold protein YncE